jgi:hypothetical protein
MQAHAATHALLDQCLHLRLRPAGQPADQVHPRARIVRLDMAGTVTRQPLQQR